MQRGSWRPHRFLLAIALAVSLSGCRPSASDTTASGSDAPQAESGTVYGEIDGPVLAAGQQDRTRITVERIVVSSAGEAGSDGTLPGEPLATAAAGKAPSEMRARDTVALMPEDFAIGILQDTVVASVELRSAAEAIITFLRGLAAGEVTASIVDPNVLDDLRRSLEPELRQGLVPSTARIGAVEESGDLAWAKVRLFGPGRVEGEVYLARHTGGWAVADVQLDLRALSAPYEPSGEPFFPASYRWLLINS